MGRNLRSLSDLDLDKHIGDMMGEENVSETQSSSGSKRLRRKISKEGKVKDAQPSYEAKKVIIIE